MTSVGDERFLFTMQVLGDTALPTLLGCPVLRTSFSIPLYYIGELRLV